MTTVEDIGVRTSKWRILCAGLFGLLLAAFLVAAANSTIPRLMVISSNTDLAATRSEYETMGLLRFLIFIFSCAIGSGVAGFLSRRNGVVAGLIANSFNIGLFSFLAYGAIYGVPLLTPPFGMFDTKVEVIAVLCIVVVVAAIGGIAGELVYTPELDLDQLSERATIFGIRWWHYFWIFPIVYLAFVESLIVVVYAWVNVIWKDTSYAWHPSLWLSISAWFFLVLSIVLAHAATVVTIGGLSRFHQTMWYESRYHGWGKFGRVLLYGVGAPALSYPLAALASDAARAMPTPAHGDWKVAVGLVALFFLIAVVGSAASWWHKQSSRRRLE